MKLSIGYICSSESWGGLEMNQVRNAQWMDGRGHKVVFFGIENSSVHKAVLECSLEFVAIPRHKKYYDQSAGKNLANLLRKHSISHLIVRATRDMSVSAIAKRKLRGELHLSYFMEMQLGVKKTNLLHTLRFKSFDLWSCPLNWLAEQVRTMTNFDSNKITVIPSGLDLSTFGRLKTKEEARKELELPQEPLIIGLIGRFDIQKGQLLLIEALSKAQNKEFKICFLGEPNKEDNSDYANQMEQMVKEKNLENRVFIRPFRKDVTTFYNAIDAFVMATKAETFGMVTIEAMSCGTPVIASNAGGSPEILNFGEFGYLFETLNSDSLAEKLDAFCEHPLKFSPEKLMAETIKYDHVLVCEQVEKELTK